MSDGISDPIVRAEFSAAAPARPVRLKPVAWAGLVAFLLAHFVLGYLSRRWPVLGTAHALAAVAIGGVVAAFSGRAEHTVYVLAYLAGSEVLWRMCGANVFWEFGKYSVVLLAVVSMLRRQSIGFPVPAVLYFLALVPSAVITAAEWGWEDARSGLSSDLSGPLALVVSACFFAGVKLTREQFLRTAICLIGPALSIALFAVTATATAEAIHFSRNSNMTTSGGFGPNQVSSILGLGVVFSFLASLHERASLMLKAVLVGGLVVLLAQCAMTFSRTGLYLAVLSTAAAAVYLCRDKRLRARLAVVFCGVVFVVAFVVFPALNAFTSGALLARFKDTGSTHRDEIAKSDLAVWSKHPIFGVGVNQSRTYRKKYGLQGGAAHTEFTRLLSEHGAFGLVAAAMLVVMATLNVLRPAAPVAKAVVVAVVVWSFLFMMGTGTRVAAPMVLLGLTFARFVPDPLRVGPPRSEPDPLPGWPTMDAPKFVPVPTETPAT